MEVHLSLCLLPSRSCKKVVIIVPIILATVPSLPVSAPVLPLLLVPKAVAQALRHFLRSSLYIPHSQGRVNCSSTATFGHIGASRHGAGTSIPSQPAHPLALFTSQRLPQEESDRAWVSSPQGSLTRWLGVGPGDYKEAELGENTHWPVLPGLLPAPGPFSCSWLPSTPILAGL